MDSTIPVCLWTLLLVAAGVGVVMTVLKVFLSDRKARRPDREIASVRRLLGDDLELNSLIEEVMTAQGMELNALVAKHLFDWEYMAVRRPTCPVYPNMKKTEIEPILMGVRKDSTAMEVVPGYCSDDRQALDLVRKMRDEYGLSAHIFASEYGNTWSCEFYLPGDENERNRYRCRHEQSLALAVCRAAVGAAVSLDRRKGG